MSDLSQLIPESIIATVEQIVDNKISTTEYNTTIKGQIVNNDKALNGLYTVKYESSLFEAYTQDTTLEVGDMVQVLITNNNSNAVRIILNKIVSSDETISTNTDLQNYLDITGNVVDVFLQSNAQLLANSSTTEQLLWEYTDTIELAQFSQMKISAQFRSFLKTATAGDYGLHLQIMYDQQIVDLYLSSEEMTGNPYNFIGYTKQQKIFDLSQYNANSITSIGLYFYQEENSFLDNDNNQINYKDSFGNELSYNLFVKDINLSFGYSLNEYTPGVDKATITVAKGYSTSFNTDTESIICNLNWIHWNDDKTNILSQEELLLNNNYTIEWYRYQLYSEAVTLIQQSETGYSGATDEVIKQNQIDDLGCSYIDNQNWQHLSDYDNQFSCEISVNSNGNQNEQIRAFIILDDSENILQTEILTLTNENNIQDKNHGLVLTTLDGSNGDYYLYTESGILNNANTKTRILKAQYYDSTGEEIDIVNNNNYIIAWASPNIDNSMLQSGEIGISMDEYIYSIKPTYNPNYIDNFIECTLTYNDGNNLNTFTQTINFDFGYANLSNQNLSLQIEYYNKLLNEDNIYYVKNALQVGDTYCDFILSLYDANGKLKTISDESITWQLKLYKKNSDSSALEDVDTETEYTLTAIANDNNKIDNSIVRLRTTNENGFNFDYYIHIIAEVTSGETKASINFPVAISANLKKYNNITGATTVIYKTLGVPLYNKEPYELYDYNSEPISTEVWNYIGDSYCKITDGAFVPNSAYINNLNECAVYATIDNEVVWMQPITIIQSQFASNTINQWDGVSCLQDDDSGTFVAPRLAAGKKTDENKFTGIMIGDWADDQESESTTGVFGFRENKPCFGLRDSGTAFFGEEGTSQILFDGNSSTIQSAGYIENKGMLINLDNNTQEFCNEIEGDDNTKTTYCIKLDASKDNLSKTAKAFQIGIDDDPAFYVQWDGKIKATAGTIAGWTITENYLHHEMDNNQDMFLATSPMGTEKNIQVQFGNNFLVTNKGTLQLTNLSVLGTLTMSGSAILSNFFTTATVSMQYSIPAGGYITYGGNYSIPNYQMLCFLQIEPNHHKKVKISAFSINNKDNYWQISLSNQGSSRVKADASHPLIITLGYVRADEPSSNDLIEPTTKISNDDDED